MVGNRQNDPIKVSSVFFGGGTPSLLSIDQFSAILNQLQRSFAIPENIEFTLEANPGTVSQEYLVDLNRLGFNRISFGMQSAHPQDLAILDRQHEYLDVVHAVDWSRLAGFKHINLDLIFGIPGQTQERWLQTLTLASQFEIDHLSLYSLTIEEGTPLYLWNQHGLLDVIDDDLAADMYQYAAEMLDKAGFQQYEISNWALRCQDGLDARCQHNLNIWRYQSYFGFGAGAHGFINHTRTANVGPIPAYLHKIAAAQKVKACLWPAAEVVTELNRWDEMQEWMMIGLRLTDEGISKKVFANRFGVALESVFQKQINGLIRKGLLEVFGENAERLRLTGRGKMLGNQVFMEFVGNEKPNDLRII